MTDQAPPKLTFEEFQKLDLKIGKVLEATLHPNADRLYVLKVDLSTEIRQIVAGIKPWYPDPAVLVGRLVVVVANLATALKRGIESQGMILAATGGGAVSVLSPDRDVPPGSKVS